jgi:NADPH2:quinone reductase
MELAEVPDPVAGPGEIVVRVLASVANFPDALMCRGQYQARPPLPFIPGIELCGEVVSLGEGVTTWKVGERVIGSPAFPSGAFAERTLMRADRVYKAPEVLDDAEAAGFYIGYQTGWFGLHRRAGLRAGDTLLVHAAAGGVGSAAVQIGKAAGARVIGVVGGAEKAECARQLGADVTIDRYTEDFVPIVKDVTGGRGADVIYDPVGGEAYDRSAKCVAFEGRVLVVGFAGGKIPQPALNHALVKNYSIMGLHWGLYASHDPAAVSDAHESLTDLASQGAIKPLISERLPLESAADAVQRVADGTTVGRIALMNK